MQTPHLDPPCDGLHVRLGARRDEYRAEARTSRTKRHELSSGCGDPIEAAPGAGAMLAGQVAPAGSPQEHLAGDVDVRTGEQLIPSHWEHQYRRALLVIFAHGNWCAEPDARDSAVAGPPLWFCQAVLFLDFAKEYK